MKQVSRVRLKPQASWKYQKPTYSIQIDLKTHYGLHYFNNYKLLINKMQAYLDLEQP